MSCHRDHTPPEEEADAAQDATPQRFTEWSNSTPRMGHMEAVWAGEGVKAGARRCWMIWDAPPCTPLLLSAPALC